MGGPDRPKRNRATSNSVASLILWILRRRAVSPTASDAMLAFMQRELKMTGGEEDQVTSFIGEALPAGTKLWSKAGWTSEVRHDSALLGLPGGRRVIVVIFTRGTADDKTLLPAITKTLLGELGF